MKNLSIHHPFLFGLLVAMSAVLSQVWPIWIPNLSHALQILLARATGLAITIILLSRLHWWQEAGFNRIHSWRILLPYLPLIMIVLLSMVGLVGKVGIRVNDPKLILLGAVSFLAGGFIEEALFRGIVLRAFLPRRLLYAALLSSVIFSLAHLPNLLLGQAPGATALQLLRTFVLGFAFIAPLAYTRNISRDPANSG
jgi:membrane protease YdiL (CAAX protease family)